MSNKSPFRKENLQGWEKQLERGLNFEGTRKQRGRRAAKIRQLNKKGITSG